MHIYFKTTDVDPTALCCPQTRRILNSIAPQVNIVSGIRDLYGNTLTRASMEVRGLGHNVPDYRGLPNVVGMPFRSATSFLVYVAYGLFCELDVNLMSNSPFGWESEVNLL